MESLAYFYINDTQGKVITDGHGDPVFRKHQYTTVDMVKCAVSRNATTTKVMALCEAVADTEQWKWLAAYQKWTKLKESITARADAVEPMLDGAGDPVPNQWHGESSPEQILATIPAMPVRPEVKSGDDIYASIIGE